jgi:ElaB/YqjD/DUF883 family membrane-anchored ribosome-binding protein
MAQRRKRRNGNGSMASVAALQADLAALQAGMGKIIAGLGGAASARMDEAAHAAEEVVDQVETYGQEGVDTMRSTIRSQPLIACAISVGAGALIGALLARQ